MVAVVAVGWVELVNSLGTPSQPHGRNPTSNLAIAHTSASCQVARWVSFLYPTYTMKNLATVGWVELVNSLGTPSQPHGRNPTSNLAIAHTSAYCKVPCWVSFLNPTYKAHVPVGWVELVNSLGTPPQPHGRNPTSNLAIAHTSAYFKVPCWVSFLYPTYKAHVPVGWVELVNSLGTPSQPNGRNPTSNLAIAPISASCKVPCWVSFLNPTYKAHVPVGWVELVNSLGTPSQPNGRNPTSNLAIAPISASCQVPRWVSFLYPTYVVVIFTSDVMFTSA